MPEEVRAIARAGQHMLEGLRGEEVQDGLPQEIRPTIEELLKQIEGVNE